MSNIEKIKVEIERLKKCSESAKMEWIDNGHNQNAFAEDCRQKSFDHLLSFINSLQQEQPDKESLNESQQEFVDIVTERMLKEGPIPTLKGKQKAEFEKEFNRFKQITGMINFPAHMEVYKRIILWFMAWGADNLPNLGKPIDLGKMDIQQEQPTLPDNLDEAAHNYAWEKQEHHIDFDGDEYLDYGTRYDAFKAGAEWMNGYAIHKIDRRR